MLLMHSDVDGLDLSVVKLVVFRNTVLFTHALLELVYDLGVAEFLTFDVDRLDEGDTDQCSDLF